MTRPDLGRPTGAKNFHGIVRLKHGIVKGLIKGIVSQEKALSKLQICRKLNGQDITFCKYARTCYANTRKRAEYDKIHVADCKISFMQIRYAIKKLVAEGIVTVTKQRWPDHWQNRGWDNMAICRPVIGGFL